MTDAPDHGRPTRRRGQLTPAGRRRAALNAVRHNGYGRSAVVRAAHCPLTDRCGGCGVDREALCPVFERSRRERIARILALPWIRPEHAEVVGEFVATWLRMQTVDLFVQRLGLVRVTPDGLDTHPILRQHRGHLGLLFARLADRLGLTPAAMRELKLDEPIDVGGPSLEAIRAEYAAADAADPPAPAGDRGREEAQP